MQNNGAIFSVNKSAELGWLSQTIKIDRSAEFAGKLAASKKKTVTRTFTIHKNQHGAQGCLISNAQRVDVLGVSSRY